MMCAWMHSCEKNIKGGLLSKCASGDSDFWLEVFCRSRASLYTPYFNVLLIYSLIFNKYDQATNIMLNCNLCMYFSELLVIPYSGRLRVFLQNN